MFSSPMLSTKCMVCCYCCCPGRQPPRGACSGPLLSPSCWRSVVSWLLSWPVLQGHACTPTGCTRLASPAPPCSWVINLASPIVGVPFRIFILALVGGHLPINFISVKVGAALCSFWLELCQTRVMLVHVASMLDSLGRCAAPCPTLTSSPSKVRWCCLRPEHQLRSDASRQLGRQVQPTRFPAPPPPPPSSPQAGHNLATMQSVSDMYSAGNVFFLVCAGSLALVPILLRRLRRGDRSARGHARPAGRAVQVVSLLPIVAHAGPGGGGGKAAANGSGGSIAVVKQQLGALAGGGVPKLALPAVTGVSPLAPKLSPAFKRTEGQHVL